MAAAAPLPQPKYPALEQSGEKLSIMDEVRETLRRVKRRSTGKVQEDSRLFKLKAKLTEMASEGDVERRRQYIAAADNADESSSAAPTDG